MPLPPSFRDQARALIAADSVSARGNRAAVDVLAPLYEAAGLPVARDTWSESIDGAPEAEHVNLLAGPGGPDLPGGVVFVTHSDTVPGGPTERWTETGGDPRALAEKDGVLFGLGVADVKLDALCKIEAARRVRGKELARPFWLVSTAAEEVGLRGARRFAGSDAFKRLAPSAVLCGEPSELGLIVAHKGYAVVRCTITDARARLVPSDGPGVEELVFSGKAAHSSTPALGVNAIHKALAWSEAAQPAVLSIQGGAAANVVPARCVARVPAPRPASELRPDEARSLPAQPPSPDLWRALQTARALEELWRTLLSTLEPRSDSRFEPPGAVGAMNQVWGGPHEGKARVQALFDGRLLPEHDPDRLLGRFLPEAQAWVQRLGGGELTLEVSVERNAGGMSLPGEAPLVQAVSKTLLALGLDGAPRAKPTSTEAGVFARAGVPAVVVGPGRSTGNAHQANERVEVAQLAKAIDLYEALILALCR